MLQNYIKVYNFDSFFIYDKTCDHYVVYYKECKNEEEMDLIEDMVIKKLDKYKEVANRDRFVLPIENVIYRYY
jgi:hypothetical protein